MTHLESYTCQAYPSSQTTAATWREVTKLSPVASTVTAIRIWRCSIAIMIMSTGLALQNTEGTYQYRAFC